MSIAKYKTLTEFEKETNKITEKGQRFYMYDRSRSDELVSLNTYKVIIYRIRNKFAYYYYYSKK